MSHPEEQLAAYVDGTLDEAERSEVDAHVVSCAICRAEVGLATLARSALADLPEAQPSGDVLPAERPVAVGRAERRRTSRAGRWYWAAGLAAAAGLVGIFVLVARPDGLGRGGGVTALAPERGGDEAEAGGAPLVRERRDYDAPGVQALAGRLAKVQPADAQAEGDAASAGAGVPGGALICITEATGVDRFDDLVQVIEARYEAEPAYLAAFLERRAPGKPPDALTIWVVATTDCTLLHFASQPA